MFFAEGFLFLLAMQALQTVYVCLLPLYAYFCHSVITGLFLSVLLFLMSCYLQSNGIGFCSDMV